MKHLDEFKLNENTDDLTSEQKNSIRHAEKKGYKYIGTKMSGKNLCAVVTNDGYDDTINIFPDGTDYQGLSIEKSIAGFWIDPAGGVHSPDDDDPASMYEKNLKHLKEFKLNG